MARIREATNYEAEILAIGWQFAELSPQAASSTAGPVEALAAVEVWTEASVPSTVASTLRAAGAWDWTTHRNFDASDWWYRLRFASAPCSSGEALWLELDGLATLSDVWLNGTHVLRSENMFLAHELDVSALVRAENELFIRFASLDQASAASRPRPRFKTRLIARQQLRWFRTTLLGRIPGWTPPVTAVGPWRSIRLQRRRAFSVRRAKLTTRIEAGRALVTAHLELETHGRTVTSSTLRVGAGEGPLHLSENDDGTHTLSGTLELSDAARWWPNGYGDQPRYPASVSVSLGEQLHELRFDPLAFRELRVDTDSGRFAFVVNGQEIRCRGACWTPSDVVSLGDDALTVATVQQAHDAGMNMLRVGGTMIYESDAFYEACDRLGILVWQDFMFANCDYPGEDAAFRASVKEEAEQFLRRSETRACLAMLCGNSEVKQQIAMLGLPRESWKVPLFEQLLRDVSSELRADVPYVASTPTGGALPFQPDVGLTHYYGVGAYLRSLEDARRADVKFTPECLGFANIPEDATIESVLGDGRAPFHDPRWKARVPRDSGPGWDFDDVRDHYTRLLFDVDPAALRYEDPERALALGRVTSGEVMARTLAEWRRPASSCRGALIWFLRDLWPGAGWGLIDALGAPKAAYYFVKRAMQAQAVFLSDEGLSGLVAHAVNDRAQPLTAEFELQLIRNGSVRVATGKTKLTVPARGAVLIETSTLFDHFIDVTHAYRFGPRQFDVAVATLREVVGGELISQACYFPGGLDASRVEDLGVEADLEWERDDDWRLRVRCQRFAHAIALDIPGFRSEDSYFDLSPGAERNVRVTALQPGKAPKGFVRPLNAQTPTRVVTAPRRISSG